MTEGSEITRVYDFATGLLMSVTDANNQTATTDYDSLLRPIRVNPPSGGSVSETIYNDDNANLWVKSRQQIDEYNWAEKTTFYDSLGRAFKSRTKDLNGDVETQVKFDNLGRVKASSNPYRVNASGQPAETVFWSKPRYDELNRAVESYAPAAVNPDDPLARGATLGTVEFGISTEPNLIGSYVVAKDASGRKSRSITGIYGIMRVDEATGIGGTTDADLGSLASPTQPTSYQYDLRGNLTQANQSGQTRTFTYDSFSRIKTSTNPESGLIKYTYDDFGNLKTKRDARGIKTIYDYDKVGRITTRCYRVIGTGALGSATCEGNTETAEPNTPDVNYYYDGKGLTTTANFARGHLTKVQSSASNTLYTNFDNHGRLLSHQQITDGNTYDTSYKYNLSGALIEEKYPSGKVVRNFLDADGELSKVVRNGKVYASDFSYTSAGAIEKMRLGNGNWESTNYNERFQPIQIGLGNASTNTTNLWKVNYEYGELSADGTTVNTAKNIGNIAKQVITAPTVGTNQGFTATQTYSYDALNRLKTAKETIPNQTGWQQTFNYDVFGNRNFDEAATTTLPKLCMDGNQSVVCPNDRKSLNPTVNTANNRLTLEQGYEYDANGNMTKDAEGKRFTYDALNKQKIVKDASNVTLGTYFYDGEGKRVKKTSNLDNTLFVYDGFGSLIAEYSIDTPQPNPTPNISYLTSDTLGSPRIITGKNGEVLSRRDFMPFGEEIASNENNRKTALGYNYASTTRQAFTGYEKDLESDLEFAQNRYYSNKTGRFTTPDPMMASGNVQDAQSWNRYAYVRNNPMNLTDPLGLIFGTRPGENFVTYFKDLDALKAAGATEVSSYFYQVGSTIYALHPTLNITSTAATFEEAARIFVNNWGGSAGLAAAAWAAAGLAVEALPAALVIGAVAITVACGTGCPQKAETFHQNYSNDLAKLADSIYGNDFYQNSGVYQASSIADEGTSSEQPSNASGASTSNAQPPQDPNKPTYKPNPKHGKNQNGNASPAPTNPEAALERSVQAKQTSDQRVAADPKSGEYVVFQHEGNNVFHGYAVKWSELRQHQRNALVKSGQATKKGKIIE